MKLFRIILQTHSEADGYLARRESDARSPSGKSKWADRRMYNDHAYFVMLFAQLENLVNRRCEALFNRKKDAPEWKTRRLWDSIDSDRLSFLQKVAMLCEKGKSDYQQVQKYYKIRCDIAHGDSAKVGPIVLPLRAPDIVAIARKMR